MPGAVSLRPDRNDTIRPTEEQYHDNNCICFWNAFIPQPLRATLTRELHDLVLRELLFQRSAWQLRVIPRLFLRDMRTFLNGDHRDFTRLVGLHYSPSLHCALLAEALQLAPPGSPLLHRSNRDALIQAADELAKLQVTQNVGVASATQAMASIAQYELAHGLTRQGYLRIRNAIEVARLSGFHHEFVSDGLPSEDGDPLRKLCYLSLLVQVRTRARDSLYSSQLTRLLRTRMWLPTPVKMSARTSRPHRPPTSSFRASSRKTSNSMRKPSYRPRNS